MTVLIDPTLSLSPSALNFAALGQTSQLQVSGVNASGNAWSAGDLTWHSSDETVVTVVAGLATAIGNGVTTIIGSVGDLADTVTVTVSQSVSTVTLSSIDLAFEALGDTQTLTAVALDANDNVVEGVTATWSSADPTVASVSATGTVTAVANGSTTVAAAVDGVAAQSTVTVQQTVATVSVDPAAVTLAAIGASVQLAAVPLDPNGNPISGAAITWSTDNPAVASVSVAALVTAESEGTATITASSGSVSGVSQVTVDPAASTIVVTPGDAQLSSLGDQVRLSATVLDDNGNPVGDATVTWSSSDETVATVNGTGLVTAIGNGSATITAASGGVSASSTVTVTQVAASMAVGPSSLSFGALGDQSQLSAVVSDANGNAMVGASVTWSSSDVTVVTVSPTGLATAVDNGSVSVTAVSGGVSGSSSITVSQVATSIAVTPSSVSFGALGDQAQLFAVVSDANDGETANTDLDR
ncbi:MAG: Ig domain-containing protein, partial [Gemmatimonadales bacterium]